VRDWARRWEKDEVVCMSMRIIKLWATAKELHSPMNNTLNSMGYMVMLLAVAGQEQAVLPENGHFLSAVVDLLARFFSTYAASLRPGVARAVIHAPHGDVAPAGSREAEIFRLSQNVVDTQSTGFGTTMFVQDPFLDDVNLARFVDRRSIKRITAAFQEADKLLTSEAGRCSFQRLVAKRRAR
jgi:hypothetical protein